MSSTIERVSNQQDSHVLLEDTEELFSQFQNETPPNIGKFFYSMRRMGYDNGAALGDIVDNSIDAGATLVKVAFQVAKGEHVFTVVDDGYGMNDSFLQQAMRLGSDTSRDQMGDLGFYGMGLITASISIGRCITVVTKEKDGPMLHAVQDLDVMERLNRFVTQIGEADEEHKALYGELLGSANSGTIVRISKCDQVQDKNTTQFAVGLVKRFARTYRMFLSSEQPLTLCVNEKKVHPHDPLMLGEDGTQLEYDQNLDVSYTDAQGGERSEKVRVRIVKLPNLSQDMNKELGINQQNQGFCLMRNNREIGCGSWYGLWGEKHPDLNRVRGEIFFPGVLDDVVGVDFTKQSPKFKQSLIDQLRDKVYNDISRLKNQNAKERKTEKDSQVSHSEAEQLIAQKANLLPRTRIEIERRERDKKERELREREEEARQPGRSRVPRKTQEVLREPKLPCRFLTQPMTSAGPIFDAEVANGVLTIYWNRDHVFYERFVLDNKDNPSMLVASDFLVFALAKAELGYTDENTKGVLEDIRGTLSSVMRQLLT
ncbi:MAG: ATP-binding protein [Armatimonadota bacterium]|nr:ATP-binding protein [Armatimonadota bacterium]